MKYWLCAVLALLAPGWSWAQSSQGVTGGGIPICIGTTPTDGYLLTYSAAIACWIAQANGGSGSLAFSGLTGGTNTAAAMVVGSGASLGVSGSGTIGATSVPLSGITGLGSGVSTFLATPSSANFAAAVTDETGSGSLVFGTSPTLVTPAIKGSSTGVTTIASANAGASNFTATAPANTGTIAELNLAQTWTALQTFSGIAFSGTGPTVSACGGGAPAADTHATSTSGSVTVGTGAVSSCTVTFAIAYVTWNHCAVNPHQSIAAFAYSYTLSAITVTATSLTSDVFDYRCDGS